MYFTRTFSIVLFSKFTATGTESILLRHIPSPNRQRLRRTLSSERNDSTINSRTGIRVLSNESDNLSLPCAAQSYRQNSPNTQQSIDVVAQINSPSTHQQLYSYNRSSFSRLAFRYKRSARKELFIKPGCREITLSSSFKQATYRPTFIHVRSRVYLYDMEDDFNIDLPTFCHGLPTFRKEILI